MKVPTTTPRGARRDVVAIAVIAGGFLVGVLIALVLVDWAHVTKDALCTADNASPLAACTVSVPAASRSLVVAMAAVLMGAIIVGAAQFLFEATGAADDHVSPRSAAPRIGAPPVEPVAELPAPGVDDGAPTIMLRCIQVLDRNDAAMASDALTRQQLEAALTEAGCSSFAPTGRVFDGRMHRAVDQIRTDDPMLAGTIAITERVGWYWRDQIIRPADVVVYVAVAE